MSIELKETSFKLFIFEFFIIFYCYPIYITECFFFYIAIILLTEFGKKCSGQ